MTTKKKVTKETKTKVTYKPFPTYTLANERAVLIMIAKHGFKDTEDIVSKHIKNNAEGTSSKAFWIDVNRYLKLYQGFKRRKNPAER